MSARSAALSLPRPRALSEPPQQSRDALGIWAVFFLVFVLIDGTIPFLLGGDLRWWSTSLEKRVLIGGLVYGVMFLVVPVAVVLRRRAMNAEIAVLLLFALIGLALQPAARGAGIIVPLAIACLHARYDLSELGIRSRGWRVDVVAIGALAVASLVLTAVQRNADAPAISGALVASLDRLLFNPASTVENLFYFGFLTERLARWLGTWATPLAVGGLYLAHELSNPEYWYSGLEFALTFIGAAALAAFYLWRRNVVAVWLADGACRFTSRSF